MHEGNAARWSPPYHQNLGLFPLTRFGRCATLPRRAQTTTASIYAQLTSNCNVGEAGDSILAQPDPSRGRGGRGGGRSVAGLLPFAREHDSFIRGGSNRNIGTNGSGGVPSDEADVSVPPQQKQKKTKKNGASRQRRTANRTHNSNEEPDACLACIATARVRTSRKQTKLQTHRCSVLPLSGLAKTEKKKKIAVENVNHHMILQRPRGQTCRESTARVQDCIGLESIVEQTSQPTQPVVGRLNSNDNRDFVHPVHMGHKKIIWGTKKKNQGCLLNFFSTLFCILVHVLWSVQQNRIRFRIGAILVFG